MKNKQVLITTIAIFCASQIAHADSNSGNSGPYFASFYVGQYRPSSFLVRGVLSDTWTSFGLNLRPQNSTNDFNVDISGQLLFARKGANQVNALQTSIGVNWSPKSLKSRVLPYATARVGITAIEFKINGPAHQNPAASANFELGLAFNESLRIGARFDMISKQLDYDFSGRSIFLEYRVMKF